MFIKIFYILSTKEKALPRIVHVYKYPAVNIFSYVSVFMVLGVRLVQNGN